jgi:hypothetical protein
MAPHSQQNGIVAIAVLSAVTKMLWVKSGRELLNEILSLVLC